MFKLPSLQKALYTLMSVKRQAQLRLRLPEKRCREQGAEQDQHRVDRRVLSETPFLLVALHDRCDMRDCLQRHRPYLSKFGIAGCLEQEIENDRPTSLKQRLVRTDDALEVNLK